ncbi:MAG TPA: sigma-54 dependent transcriptional regulator [Planctomycetota bacterium]|nr:sigma-54 dependent transcriptional regulator [Planctomycetota bacterium]
MLVRPPQLIGTSAAFTAFRARLEQVAASDATVLIRGESGSGKDLAAAALHAASPRAAGPLVVVSLAALAPTLVEAELFGHEEGAFTGAHRARLGRLRQAHGGTLVVDDVDSLPGEVQSKLVRVLQSRVVEPLGAEHGVPVDVRLVCTTQRDLAAEVQAGRFRGDLYWRLAVVPLEAPPLRARLEDLPELARHLVRRLASERRLVPRELEPAALERLAAPAWPGNVRELENALERVLVLAERGAGGAPPVRAEELEFLAQACEGVAPELAERALAHGVTLEALERALLEAAVRQQRGNLAAAARQLGLTRRALEYRLGRFAGEAAGREGQAT